MSDETENKPSLSLKRPGRLQLQKTVETGQVRQSFAHGRSKAVTVEVRRKRTFAPGEGGRMTEIKTLRRDGALASEGGGAGEADGRLSSDTRPRGRRSPTVLKTLTAEEKEVRARALEIARRDIGEAEHRKASEATEQIGTTVVTKPEVVKTEPAAEAPPLRPEVDEAKLKPAPEAPEPKRERGVEAAPEGADETRRQADSDARRKADEEAARRLAQAEEAGRRAQQKAAANPNLAEETETSGREEGAERGRRSKGDARRPPIVSRRKQPRRRGGKITVSQALSDDERVRSLASVRRARERERRAQQQPTAESMKVIREVVVPEALTVQELANRMAVRGGELIKALMKMGTMATITQTIDADTAELLVAEFGHKVKRVSEADVEIGLKGDDDPGESLRPRAPVVTVMGHVDHGKTSLLDALRHTDVAAGEAGGITQHIGAYKVKLNSGGEITFLDTPGHEAFTSMRSRGARVTDVVILVVAADDGVMPQTEEAITHAKAAEVPIIVAINKMDRPDANPERVRNDLLKHGLVLEELGGDILSVEVSATKQTNLEKLEEAILLQAEILDLKANPERPAQGVVIEAQLDRGRGPVATLLVQRGTLRVGDIIVTGKEWGKVRALNDDKGRSLEVAGPATPVEVLGLGSVPQPGDEMATVENERRAREVSRFREERQRMSRAASGARGSMEQMFAAIQAGEVKELVMVLKADVQGSLEAIIGSLDKLGTDEVRVRVIHGGVGAITESDVALAKASEGLILGFNVRANGQARELAQHDGLEIRYYSVIYDVLNDVKAVLTGMLSPDLRERVLGNAQVLEIFDISKIGKIAGCRVSDGIIKRNAKVRLLRDNIVIHEGSIGTLRRFKEDAREVKEGLECGMSIDRFQDIRTGDVIEAFEMEEVARTL